MSKHKPKISPRAEPKREVQIIRPDAVLPRLNAPRMLLRPVRARGPFRGEFTCTAAWDVVNDDSTIMRFLKLEETYGNKRILYHGTPHTNVTDIAREGLHKGRSHCMFGAGIYLGEFKKAFDYARPFLGSQTSRSYVFEVEVVLGRSYLAKKSEKFTQKQLQELGCQSVHGSRNHTASWGGTLAQDEWVIYSPDQVLVTRLYEYTKTAVEKRVIIHQGICQLRTTQAAPMDKSRRAFADVLSQKTCERKAYTRLALEGGGSLWACTKCIKQQQLRIGSKVEVRSEWRKPVFRRIVGVKD